MNRGDVLYFICVRTLLLAENCSIYLACTGLYVIFIYWEILEHVCVYMCSVKKQNLIMLGRLGPVSSALTSGWQEVMGATM